MTTPLPGYTLQQAQRDIADLRGVIAHLLLSRPNGFLVAAGADGNNYSTSSQILIVPSNVPVTSTSPSTVLTTNVIAGEQYLVSGWVRGLNGSSGTLQAQTIRFSGTCTVSSILVRVWTTAEFANTSSPPMANGAITALNADPSNTRTPALNEDFDIVFEGIVNVNGSGTLTLQAREVTSSSDVSWTALANSFMVLRPAN